MICNSNIINMKTIGSEVGMLETFSPMKIAGLIFQLYPIILRLHLGSNYSGVDALIVGIN